MDIRIPITILAIIQIIAPRRFNRFWIGLVSPDAEEIELRSGVPTLTRVEGLVLLGWVLWRSREDLGDYAPEDIDTGIEIEDIGVTEDDQPTLTEGTRRFDIASVLYHAEDSLAASDVVDLSEGEDWEMGRSTASATLYRMYNDDLVDREEREDDGSFVYWLTEQGQETLESGEAPIRPNPFA